MVELKREFYNTLKDWKRTKGRECLLVKGARQIGKTFIIEKFGRENYASLVSVNFISSPECIAVFDGSLDAGGIYAGLSAIFPEARFIPGDTLLFFGPTTGVVKTTVTEIRLDDSHILAEAAAGDLCSVSVPERVRRGDKVYLFHFSMA